MIVRSLGENRARYGNPLEYSLNWEIETREWSFLNQYAILRMNSHLGTTFTKTMLEKLLTLFVSSQG